MVAAAPAMAACRLQKAVAGVARWLTERRHESAAAGTRGKRRANEGRRKGAQAQLRAAQRLWAAPLRRPLRLMVRRAAALLTRGPRMRKAALRRVGALLTITLPYPG